MCGRARCTVRADDVPRACHRTGGPARTINMDRYRPLYNVAPGSNIPVIRRDYGSVGGDGFVLHCMKWGLIPSFTKKTEKPDFYKMFNARSESIAEKASFRRLLPKSRCLVVVEGFYEWKKDGSKKQPYYIHFKDGRPLVFAALYDSWQNSEGEILYTFTIVTTSSSSALQWLHARMPVILGDKESTDAWLNGSSSSKYDRILKPYEGPDLVWYQVTPAMGKPSFDGPECIKEIQVKTEEKNSISNFFLKKDIKKEQASNTKESAFDEFVKMNQLKDMKEGPGLIKKVKEEQESSLDEKCSSDKTDQTNLAKSVKGETVTADDIRTQSSEERGDHNAKSINSMLSNVDTTKFPQKRDYEFIADSKSAADKTDKLGTSPSKRKGNLKDVGDKKPTLFSYFSKK